MQGSSVQRIISIYYNLIIIKINYIRLYTKKQGVCDTVPYRWL